MHQQRGLTQGEIEQLEKNGCSCSNWKQVTVKNGFDSLYVRNTQFSGKT